jgi:23S rRNA pseudouridine1911/1915/1917 synthase
MQLTADQDKERVDSFLARTQPQHSRSFWQGLCESGGVVVNDAGVKPSQTLKKGDVVTVTVPERIDFSDHELPVIYEDSNVMVINKPAGLLTHAKGALNHEFSVAEFMRDRTSDGAQGNRPGIVHRLDRGTSGLIITAKTPEARQWLQKQFSTRKVKKTYVALIEGRLKQPAAVIQLPIERNPKKPQTFRVGGNGKPAETVYETTRQYRDYTLLKLTPHTGRTHQLRVHLQYLGHPIVGDEQYGKPSAALKRMFLHAAALELTLPSRERKVFAAPLPTELQQFLDALQ